MPPSRPPRQPGPAPVPMQTLLAACAAAAVISRPPRAPEPRAPRRPDQTRRAA
ncbi:hypothetical protein SAMN04490357_4741 [Streptomyces misionensis]|uniref:Uncharacterized protein n=1 Tax=Streptomyces misionensis TaxID=67331 RepID=A0A1H5AGW8_9ACTN|nr:hypothetical protein SAMN04490357_4741 [Streptomyces misionensis]SFY50798.1 hypothetical protein STEPF1_04053 [Streptomyces sp. F-1]